MSDVVYMLPSAPGLNLQGRKKRREQNRLGRVLRQAIKSIGSHLGGCFMCLSRSRCSFKMRRSRLDFLPCEGLNEHENELGERVSRKQCDRTTHRELCLLLLQLFRATHLLLDLFVPPEKTQKVAGPHAEAGAYFGQQTAVVVVQFFQVNFHI